MPAPDTDAPAPASAVYEPQPDGTIEFVIGNRANRRAHLQPPVPPVSFIGPEPTPPPAVVRVPLPWKRGDIWITDEGAEHLIIHTSPLITLMRNTPHQWNDRGERYMDGSLIRLTMKKARTTDLMLAVLSTNGGGADLRVYTSVAISGKSAANLDERERQLHSTTNMRVLALHRLPNVPIE